MCDRELVPDVLQHSFQNKILENKSKDHPPPPNQRQLNNKPFNKMHRQPLEKDKLAEGPISYPAVIANKCKYTHDRWLAILCK